MAASAKGEYQKALSYLTSAGVVTAADAIHALAALHPHAEVPQLPQADLPVSAPFTAQNIQDSLASFNKGTAAGPSGLRVQHLADVISVNPDLAETLSRWCTRVANADVPRDVECFLAAARLIPLRKKPTGIRPVAVGETLRRLVGKLVLARAAPTCRNILERHRQMGGSPGGLDMAIHTIGQAARNLGPDEVEIKVDWTNAFNCIDRALALRLCRELVPELSRYAELLYGKSAPALFVHNSLTVLRSCQGTQQGDPLASILFCLALFLEQ